MSQIGNMDETPLTFDCLSNRTVEQKGSKTVAIKTSGNEKNHFTVVLACLADGKKLPPMLIFKRKTMPKEEIPHGVLVHCHEKGWMDEDGMKIWFEKIWRRRPGGLLQKKSLLVFDQFRAHLTKKTKNLAASSKTHLAVIPGGLTSQLQPLDVSINKPFKQAIREEWNKWMMNPADQSLTPTGRLRRPTIKQVCQWVLNAWDGIKQEVIKKSFKKTGISNALDGTEDDDLYNNDSDLEDTANMKLDETDSEDEEFNGFYDY